jgi:hypothetical protein
VVADRADDRQIHAETVKTLRFSAATDNQAWLMKMLTALMPGDGCEPILMAMTRPQRAEVRGVLVALELTEAAALVKAIEERWPARASYDDDRDHPVYDAMHSFDAWWDDDAAVEVTLRAARWIAEKLGSSLTFGASAPSSKPSRKATATTRVQVSSRGSALIKKRVKSSKVKRVGHA